MNERIVFMGTASFSLEVLKMLIEEKYNIVIPYEIIDLDVDN